MTLQCGLAVSDLNDLVIGVGQRIGQLAEEMLKKSRVTTIQQRAKRKPARRRPALPFQPTTIAVGSRTIGVAVNPAGTRVYVTNQGSASVSVINAATNGVVATCLMRLLI